MSKSIYLDNSATTPLDPRVLKIMMPHLKEDFGNASSLHYAGLDNRVAVDRAQAKIAKFLNCEKGEVYFTSGATESDNMAIFCPLRGLSKKDLGKKVHIITSKIEHDAILEPCQMLEREGVEVTYLDSDENGLVKAESVKEAIREETVLVSIMYVNNEVGTIQPIEEIGKIIKTENEKRKNKIIFHTDATQALAYVDCDVDQLGVDLMSLSGHKIYGPKGVGALYVRDGIPFSPLIFGGHQQANVRPGTYNVPGIVGLGQAVEILSDKKELEKENQKIKDLRDMLVEGVQNNIDDVIVNGNIKEKTPNNANFVFKGVEGESVLLMLSEKKIAVSTGSACSSGSLEPSHVLTAMGIKPELAHGSLRITLGRFNETEDIEKIIEELPPIIEKLRKMSPLK